ncbi:MAG: ribokinase [Alphaproteobacteria bacterium]
MSGARVTILGVFVADLAFWTDRLPAQGETVMGSAFKLGPGGKGSNQAIAARRAGAQVTFITKLGADTFGALARTTYRAEGIAEDFVYESADKTTGAASIVVNQDTGDNAIVVAMGAVADLTAAEVDAAEPAIAGSAVFATNLELPIALAERGLGIARRNGVATVLNPAPAAPLPDRIYPLVDYFTPNETEAAALAGRAVATLAEAEAAADVFLDRGVGTVIVTLGERGVLFKDGAGGALIPAVEAGPVVDTTGAGDAFNGGFAVGLAEGADARAAARLGCAVAGLSVTRVGTAPSMPTRAQVDALLARR